jgi:dipeptidyl aminopeptidase/acylaminoacyl peptidase
MSNAFEFRFECIELQGIPAYVASPLQTGGVCRRPAVILHHGATCDKGSLIPQFSRFAAAGFVVLWDALFHGWRGHPKRQEWFAKDRPRLLADIAQATAAEAPILYDYLNRRHDVTRDRIGVAGWSMGGMNTYAAMIAEPRFKACVGLITTGNWALRLQDKNKDRNVAARKGVATHVKTLEKLSIVHQPKKLIRRPVLMLHGEADPGILVREAQDSYEALRPYYTGRAAERLKIKTYKNVGHTGADEMDKAALAWFRKWVQGNND